MFFTFRYYPIRIYLRYTPVQVLLVLSLLLQIILWYWLLRSFGFHGETIFLHYNILYGIDLTGPAYRIYILPLVGMLILLLNVVIGWLFFHKDKFVSIVSNFMTVICQIFLLVAASLLIFLNT